MRRERATSLDEGRLLFAIFSQGQNPRSKAWYRPSFAFLLPLQQKENSLDTPRAKLSYSWGTEKGTKAAPFRRMKNQKKGPKKRKEKRKKLASLGDDPDDRVPWGHGASGARGAGLGGVEHEQGPNVALRHLLVS